MRARYAGQCSLCGSEWAPGAPIDKWLGKWAHEGCKALRRASVASEGQRTTLPDAGRKGSDVQVTGKKLKNRQSFTRFKGGVSKLA